MTDAFAKQWLDAHIWPQIHSMLLGDAYFKLAAYANELSGCFSGPIGGLLISGYLTTQTIAVRRLCDNRSDVISLRRLVRELVGQKSLTKAEADGLHAKLDAYVRSAQSSAITSPTLRTLVGERL